METFVIKGRIIVIRVIVKWFVVHFGNIIKFDSFSKKNSTEIEIQKIIEYKSFVQLIYTSVYISSSFVLIGFKVSNTYSLNYLSFRAICSCSINFSKFNSYKKDSLSVSVFCILTLRV